MSHQSLQRCSLQNNEVGVCTDCIALHNMTRRRACTSPLGWAMIIYSQDDLAFVGSWFTRRANDHFRKSQNTRARYVSPCMFSVKAGEIEGMACGDAGCGQRSGETVNTAIAQPTSGHLVFAESAYAICARAPFISHHSHPRGWRCKHNQTPYAIEGSTPERRNEA